MAPNMMMLMSMLPMDYHHPSVSVQQGRSSESEDPPETNSTRQDGVPLPECNKQHSDDVSFEGTMASTQSHYHTSSTVTTTEEDFNNDNDDGHDQQHYHYPSHSSHNNSNRRSSSSSLLMLHTIPEDCEWLDDDNDSTTSSSTEPALPDGLAWVGILRNDTLLMDIGQEDVPESVPDTAGALLERPLSLGWDRVVTDDPAAAIAGLRFHVYDDNGTNQDDHNDSLLIVWSFLCVYNGHNLTERQAQWFVQEHLVRATHTVRAVDPAWRHGDYHAVQALWAPLVQEKIQDFDPRRNSYPTAHRSNPHCNNNSHSNNKNDKRGATTSSGELNLDFCQRIIQENRRVVLQEEPRNSRHGDELDESSLEEEDNVLDKYSDQDDWTPSQALEEDMDDPELIGDSNDVLATFSLLSETFGAASSSSSSRNNNNSTVKSEDKFVLSSGTNTSNLSLENAATTVQNNNVFKEDKVRTLSVVADDPTEDTTTTTLDDDDNNSNNLAKVVTLIGSWGTSPLSGPSPKDEPPKSSPTSVLVGRLTGEIPPATSSTKTTTKTLHAMADDDDNDHDQRPCFFCFSFWAPKQPALVEYKKESAEK